jgi:hypothetical protein
MTPRPWSPPSEKRIGITQPAPARFSVGGFFTGHKKPFHGYEPENVQSLALDVRTVTSASPSVRLCRLDTHGSGVAFPAAPVHGGTCAPLR